MPEERLLEMLRDVAYDLQGPDVNFECYNHLAVFSARHRQAVRLSEH